MPEADTPLREVRPSWWNFTRHFLVFFLILPLVLIAVVYVLPGPLGYTLPWQPPTLVVAGLIALFYVVPPIVAHVKRLARVLRVYTDRIVLEEGLLSKGTSEIFIEDIRTIDTHQGIIQRIVGTGDLTIASAGDRPETVIRGIPDPLDVKELIVERRQDNRPA